MLVRARALQADVRRVRVGRPEDEMSAQTKQAIDLIDRLMALLTTHEMVAYRILYDARYHVVHEDDLLGQGRN